LTWEDVLKREDLIGGDLESQEDGMVYRGPLSEMKVVGDNIRFISSWMARMNPETCEWKKWHINTLYVNKDMSKPQDLGDGRVFFQMPYLGVCTIFPKGGSKLDPARVEGLDVGANA